MKKTVLVFGLIAGAVLSLMLWLSVPFMEDGSYDGGQMFGYASMVLAFLLVYFGVRSYRDNVLGGVISFGRAFAVGILITLVASACYVASWQVIYYNFVPDFAEDYAEHVLEQARARGASEAEIAAERARTERFAELYRNPFYNAAVTLLEPLPVGLIMTLVTAGILRRRKERVPAMA